MEAKEPAALDLIQFGRLIQSVETLGREVRELKTTITVQNTKIEHLEARWNKGNGFLVGLLIAAGGLGAGATELLRKML